MTDLLCLDFLVKRKETKLLNFDWQCIYNNIHITYDTYIYIRKIQNREFGGENRNVYVYNIRVNKDDI